MTRSKDVHNQKVVPIWVSSHLLRGRRVAVLVALVAGTGCAPRPSSDRSASSEQPNAVAVANPSTDAASPASGSGTHAAGAEASSPLPAADLSDIFADLQLFPHIRATKALDRIEIDARVSPMLVPDPRTPLFFLETICCAPDTREHESLLVSVAKPSHVHAALLAMGLKPGKPGAWEMRGHELVPLAPTGDRVSIMLHYTTADGVMHHDSPAAWTCSTRDLVEADTKAEDAAVKGGSAAPVGNVRATRGITHSLPPNSTVEWWVFAGSRVINRPENAATTPGASPQHSAPATAAYDADGTGQIIGLHTFGSEVLAWPVNLNPDANALEPEWIAKMDAIPPAGTPVTIVIRKADQPQEK